MSGRVVVSAATAAEAALVHAVTQRAWHGTVAENSSAYRETPATVEAVFAQGGGAFVARLDGEPVGSVRWLPVAHPEPSWEIKRMGVVREARGHGLGERLAAELERAAREAGIRRLQLGVRLDQPRLLGFWGALGFEHDDTVTLSSLNPLTDPPRTMSRRLPPGDGTPGARPPGR